MVWRLGRGNEAAFMRMTVRMVLVAGAAALLAACASGDDSLQSDVSLPTSDTAIEYEAALEGAPDEDIEALLVESLSIFRLSEGGAPSPSFLTRRLQTDESLVQTILKSEGYYDAGYDYEVIAPVAKEGEAEPPKDAPWRAVARVEPGAPFTLASHTISLTEPAEGAPDLDAAKLGSPVGGRARAEEIVGAEAAAVALLRNRGYPYAEAAGRRAVADMDAETIEVESRIAPGPFVRYGEMTIEGAESVDHDYLRSYKNWEDGKPVRQTRLDEYQRELAQTGLFSSVSVRLPETPAELPPDGVAPITVTAEERLPRSLTAGVRFNSDTGPAVRGGFQHRNLFGAGESVRASADISQEEPKIEFDFRKPQYLRDEQALIAGGEALYRDDDVFTGFSSEFTLGIERRLNRHWRAGAGGSIGYDNITESTNEGEAYLLGLPMFLEFDDTPDFLNPTEGFRLRTSVTPYTGTYASEPTAYVVWDTIGSTYLNLSGDGRWVLAARGRIGSVLSGELETVTPTKRLYSGGGGSVRGYQRDFIGPLDDEEDPTGGLSVLEAGLELRAPIAGDVGGVVFLDGGTVSTEVFPNFEEEVQWATGLGFRYYSPVGPIRLDVGVPLNPRDVDNDFEFYFAIGQAF